MTTARRHRRRGALAAFPVALAAVLALAAPASAEPPWKAAEEVRQSLFQAQTDLLLDEATAGGSITAAEQALSRSLASDMQRADPDALRDARRAIAAAGEAFSDGDPVALGAARGDAISAIRRGAYAVTLAAVNDGDAAVARRWLLVRDFRKATRFTRPGVDATAAIDGLAAGDTSPEDAATAVQKDLLDAYQARLFDYLAEGEREANNDFGPALAESAALVRGYWLILDDEYQELRSAAERRTADAAFTELEDAAIRGDTEAFEQARDDVRERLDGFTAAPFTPEEQARRAAQLTRFLELVPVEWDHGTEDGNLTVPFEMQEMTAFIDAAQSAVDDLEPELDQRDPAAVTQVEEALTELRGIATDASEGREVVSQEEVDAIEAEASATLDEVMPDEWKESSDEADFDLIDISLDQMEAAVSASEYEQAEQARLSAYAFFEFGPEPKLRAFDPQLVQDVEGLVWYGARDADGLGELIADKAAASRYPRQPPDAGRSARRGARPDRRRRQRRDRDHERGDDRVPRGPRGDPDHRRDHRLDGRQQPPPAPPRLPRCAARASGEHPALHPLAVRARLARAVRREAGGGGRDHRDRCAPARDELVLPQGLLDGVDLRAPQTRAEARRRRRGSRSRHRRGALPAGLHQRSARGLRDRAVPPGPPALIGHRRGDRGRRARAPGRGRRWAPSRSSSSRSFRTSACWW